VIWVFLIFNIAGRPQQVEVALQSAVGEIDLHRTDKQGQTALHHAVIRGHNAVVDILVKHMEKYRLSLDLPDKQGLTPYIYAKKLGYFWIADALADGGYSYTNTNSAKCYKYIELIWEWGTALKNNACAGKKSNYICLMFLIFFCNIIR
jgi:hypothetical protein